MNRAIPLLLLVLLFALPSSGQASRDQARANDLPDHIQPSRNVFVKPFLDARDALLFKDKAESMLAFTQGFFLISDGVVTRANERRGNNPELDPASRILLGRYPAWNRMAPLGALQEVVGIYLGTEMKRSQNWHLRKVWWIPQVVGIGGNLFGTGYGILTR